MTPYDKALRQLPARPFRFVLEKLVALARLAEADESIRPPLVCLHMQSGRDLVGWVIRAGDPKRNEEDSLLLHNPGADPNQPWDHAVFVDTRAIESVTVYEAGHVAHLLADNIEQLPPPAPSTPPPSKFEVQRKAQEFMGQLQTGFGGPIPVEIGWDKIPQGESLRAVMTLIERAIEVFTEWAGDSTAKDAVHSNVKKIALVDGTSIGARRDGSTLEITDTFSKGFSGYASKIKLRSALSALL